MPRRGDGAFPRGADDRGTRAQTKRRIPTASAVPMEKELPGALNYISVDSVDRTLAQVTKAGGHVLMGKQEIPGWGWSAVFQAPGGVIQTIYEAGEH
jgi:predicted enzyme related to lactoylglutathione lyase